MTQKKDQQKYCLYYAVESDLHGKAYTLSTWKRKGFSIDDLVSIAINVPAVYGERSGGKYEWVDDSEPDSQYQNEFHGKTFEVNEWYEKIGYRYTLAMITAEILVQVK